MGKSGEQLRLSYEDMVQRQRPEPSDARPSWSSSEFSLDATHWASGEQYRCQGLSLERLLLDFHSHQEPDTVVCQHRGHQD
jgi:hypothetical protein